MNHNLNLNDLAASTVRDRLIGIVGALDGLYLDDQRAAGFVMERIERIVPGELFEELRAYLGAIREHVDVIHTIVFDIEPTDDEYGIENHLRPANPANRTLLTGDPNAGKQRIVELFYDGECPVCSGDDLPSGCSSCDPGAVVASKLRHPSNGANLERALALIVDDGSDAELERILDGEDVLRDLLGQLDRGEITLREFQLSLDSHSISQAHPCITDGCTNTVPFDDEPRCFTHSPDSGSSLRGWSYLRAHYTRVVSSVDPDTETCRVCGQPDNIGDCNHVIEF